MTKTPVQMLADLNALRVAKGEKPLKSWKASTVKLAEALAKAGGKIETTPKLKVDLGHLGPMDEPSTKAAKPVKVEKVVGKKRVLEDGEVHLTTIANSIKLAPKTARAIARNAKAAIVKLQVSGKKYVFSKANIAAVKAILTATPDKK